MTKVWFDAVDGGYAICAKDHATGSETACAAVSGLMYALAGYLINAERDGLVHDVRGHLAPGDAVQQWSGGAEAEAAYDLTVIGLMQIARSYPQFVAIEWKTGANNQNK